MVFKIFLLVFKCTHGICSENLISKLRFKKYSVVQMIIWNWRHKVFTKFGCRTFSYTGPRLWNSLPLNLQTKEDIVRYKGQLKILLLTDTERIKRKVFQYEWVTQWRAHLYRDAIVHQEQTSPSMPTERKKERKKKERKKERKKKERKNQLGHETLPNLLCDAMSSIFRQWPSFKSFWWVELKLVFYKGQTKDQILRDFSKIWSVLYWFFA